MACAGNGVGCVAGEAGAGAVVVVADERPDVGSNRAAGNPGRKWGRMFVLHIQDADE